MSHLRSIQNRQGQKQPLDIRLKSEMIEGILCQTKEVRQMSHLRSIQTRQWQKQPLDIRLKIRDD